MKQRLIAAAIAAAFGLGAGAASAIQVGPGTNNVPVYAKELIGATTQVTIGAGNMVVKYTSSDVIIGRNNSFNVEFVLPTGVTFAVAAPDVATQTGSAFPNCNKVAGGAVDSSSVKYACIASTEQPLVVNTTVGFEAVLKGVGSTLGAGSGLTVTVNTSDPNSGTVNLIPSATGTVATGGTAFKFTVTPGTNVPKIDVAQGSKFFVADEAEFAGPVNVGSLVLSAAEDVLGTDGAPLTNDNISAMGVTLNGGFNYAPFDKAATGSPANSLSYLTSGEDCSGTAITTPVANVSAEQIKFPSSIGLAAGTTYLVCLVADGKTAIDNGTPKATLFETTLNDRDFEPALQGSLAMLMKNGFSAYIPTVAFGTANITYLRVANNSSLAGQVFITVLNDAGTVVRTLDPIAIAANSAFTQDLPSLLGSSAPASGLGTVLISTTTPASSTKAQAFWINGATGVVSSVSASVTNNADGSN